MKQDHIYIKVEENDIETTSSGLAYGHLAVKIGETYYPDDNWQDFVQIVLCWWLVAVRKLSSDKIKANLNFMDGPFRITLQEIEDGNMWRLCFVRTTQNGLDVLCTALVDPYEFMLAVTQAANRLMRSCNRIGVNTEDGQLLETELNEMRDYLKKFT